MERSENFDLFLVDVSAEMVAAWQKQTIFSSDPKVKIICSKFQDIKDTMEYDCLVSVGNSFGMMDGGIDLDISKFFGWSLMTRVQETILEKWCGEQPVGTSMIVSTEHKDHPWLAHTPTMRSPLDIRGTDHPYTAMWAMLNAVRQHNLSAPSKDKIKTVVCPGLGTGVGLIKPEESARQMALAWKNFQLRMTVDEAKIVAAKERVARKKEGKDEDKTKDFYLLDWKHVSLRQQEICAGGTNGFLYWLYKAYPALEETIYDHLLTNKAI